MEPRPPRPRSSASGDRSVAALTGDRFAPYPAGGAPAVNPADIDLISRGERRRRGLLRLLGGVVLLALIVGGAWWFRDRLPSVSINAPSNAGAPAVVGTPPTRDIAQSTAATPAARPAQTSDQPGVASLLATATATPRPARPTAPAAASTQAAAQTAPTATPAAARQASDTTPLLDLLPGASQAPDGLALTNEAERSKSEVVASMGGTDEAAQLLDDWGWQGNAYREFAAPADNTLPAGSVNYLNVSVHRFASPDAADNALTYFSDVVVSTQGLQDVQVDPVGDAARALTGAPDGNALAVLYVRSGKLLYRIGTSTNSADGDPMAAAVAVAKEMLGG
ncbi:MAG TPA: hypothetical protein VFU81_20245 [Thermomicrobiales bacterium]|nr:hypothetical protein [Thermomicrobiales bacterium]